MILNLKQNVTIKFNNCFSLNNVLFYSYQFFFASRAIFVTKIMGKIINLESIY